MRLSDFLKYNRIVIQCHDNPDADALASGYGVYLYLKQHGKNVRFVYAGRNRITKSNLCLMIQDLHIPIEYVESLETPELLVTVDCQYGESNVTRFEAGNIAVIDHHQVSCELPEMNDVRSMLGACSTVVKELLEQENFSINEHEELATALYYGLLTDTNNFTELSHPLDKDLRDDVDFDRASITRFRNANISLQELEIAGNALLGYRYDEKYRFAVIHAEPCDPNILGMISDLMLEVDAVDTCLVYSVLSYGIKISVRSCVKEVKASELAEFITKDIGSGGGHLDKAGGFIQRDLLDRALDGQDINTFLVNRMVSYFDGVEIIVADAYEFCPEGMHMYRKRSIPCGYVVATDIYPVGTEICVRTLEGDLDIEIAEDTIIMIGTEGEVYPSTRAKFENGYEKSDEPYVYPGEYQPSIKHNLEGVNVHITAYARSCKPSGKVFIYTRILDHRVKVFNRWDEDKYYIGNVGDVLAVRCDDLHDVYIINGEIFKTGYERVE